MNGYFRIKPTSSGTELLLFAPTNGGAPLTASAVKEYLTGKAINFDPAALGMAIEKAAKTDTSLVINKAAIPPLAETVKVWISKDRMEAYITVYAGSEGAATVTVDDIKDSLRLRGVTFGYLEKDIKRIVDIPNYCEDLLVAKGQPPTDSVDGYIEYLFDTDKKKKPTLLDDGSVDFFHLNVLQSCGEGQVLAKMHLPQMGENGYHVDSTPIPPREPKKTEFAFGKNVRVSESGLELIAEKDGSISFVGNHVSVNDELSFEEIGPATGNIDFDGNVTISGNVGSNFSVKAKGDIIINGLVEAADIEATGNIVIARGVNGQGRANIIAGGNIIAKYMESTNAQAGGYISAESVMHSTLQAGGDITIDGRKGLLSGGRATSGGCIMVKNLGSEMANDTVVEVGVSPLVKREIQELRNTVAEKQKTLNQIMPTLSSMAMRIKSGNPLTNDQKAIVAKLMAAQKTTQEELNTSINRLDELEQNYSVDTASEVKVKGTVYPGTKVCISDVSMSVKTPAKYCKFVRLRGDVKITAYE